MYSQSNEERYILEYFKDTPKGTFLDCGANDGVTFSNTRALALLGWSGVLLEPNPQAFERLKTLYNGYKGFYLYPFAIRNHNGKDTLKGSGALCSPTDVGLVSTFHSHEMERFKRTVSYEPVEVMTFRWKTFQNRLRSTKISHFDFISIDCEGDDLTILSQLDLTNVKAICLEWNSKPELKKDFEHYLDGFKLIYTSGENLLYGR